MKPAMQASLPNKIIKPMKIWQKNIDVNKDIETFTVGKDRELDLEMAAFDVLGSLAHVEMLESIGLLTADELLSIQKELKNIYAEIEAGKFVIENYRGRCAFAG